jgi:NADPH-dependent F420 reductase
LLRIGILGGTGNMGRGLAIRWALKHDVLIGSRSSDRASEIAKEQENIARGYYQSEMKGSIKGKYNINAARESEIVVVALPPAAVIETTTELRAWLQPNQILISTVVSMKKSKGLFIHTPFPNETTKRHQGKSAAEVIQEIVKPTPVVSAFQTVPATYLNKVDSVMNIDVLIAGNYAHALTLTSKLIEDIPNLRPLRVGPLVNSKLIESLTPLLLNAAILNKLQEPSIRIVPWMPKSFEE